MTKKSCAVLNAFTWLSVVFTVGYGDCYLEIQMVSYDNPTGSNWAYDYCDDRVLGDYWRCDTLFTFCVDAARNVDTDVCSYFKAKSRVFMNQNNFVFGQDIKSVSNPIKVHFNAWPGFIRFKILTTDKDLMFDDKIDKFNDLLDIPAARNINESHWSETHVGVGLRDNEPSSVSYRYRVYCGPNFYNTDCKTHCIPTNGPIKHTMCVPDTGAEVCQPEWEGADCNIFSDDCIGNNCSNGATCVDKHHNYICVCVPGFTGRFCETNINECASYPCLNDGTCTDIINAFNCTCKQGYFDSTCSQYVCDRDNSPCKNNGTCFIDNENHVGCSCLKAYTGDFCEHYKCADVSCKNLGTCVDGVCICRHGFLGQLCDMNICELIACLNGATCTNGACSCAPGYTGRYCTTEINGQSKTYNRPEPEHSGTQNGGGGGGGYPPTPRGTVQSEAPSNLGHAATKSTSNKKSQTKTDGEHDNENVHRPIYTHLLNGEDQDGDNFPRFDTPLRNDQPPNDDQAMTQTTQAHANCGSKIDIFLTLAVGIVSTTLIYTVG